VRLLVVEDDDIVADAITAGWRLPITRCIGLPAPSPPSALADEEFALAVIDVGLPGSDGLTLCGACAVRAKRCRRSS